MAPWTLAVVILAAGVLRRTVDCGVHHDRCVDLDGFVGRCVKLSKCEPMADIWRTRVRTIRQSERLADSLCGGYRRNPLVCCIDDRESSLGGNVISFAKPPWSTSTTKVPKLSTTRRTWGNWSSTTTARTKSTTKSTRATKSTSRTTTSKIVEDDDEIAAQQITLTEFPWSALIQYRKLAGIYGFHCGGTLINERYVVTAAHCVKAVPRNWEISLVRLGEFDIKNSGADCDADQCSSPPVDIEVEHIVVHEEYVTRLLSQYHDIALIRLVTDVRPTNFIRPIQLPSPDIEGLLFTTLTTAVSAGWGRTKTGSASTLKMKVLLNLETLSYCAESYKSSGIKLRDGQLCASEWRGTGVCSCDSGGPLMVQTGGQFYLIGIVSLGPAKCGLKNAPGVYTSVVRYTEWIRRNIY
nr:phenoloxidase-activating factor 1-like [Aedes albopictus]